MILIEIKNFFSRQRMASLSDLSIHFGVEPDALRGILDQWIRKGKLRKLPHGKSCKKCCEACNSDHTEIYEWIVLESGIHGGIKGPNKKLIPS